MTTYKDISQQFAAYRKAEQNHVTALRAAANDLFDKYVTSLQLDQKKWTNSDGAQESYAQIGVYRDGEFHPKRMDVIYNEGASPKIRFIFSLALQADPSEMPQEHVEVKMTMSAVSQAFVLIIEPDGIEVEILWNGDDSRFLPALKAINTAILSEYDLNIFPLA